LKYNIGPAKLADLDTTEMLPSTEDHTRCLWAGPSSYLSGCGQKLRKETMMRVLIGGGVGGAVLGIIGASLRDFWVFWTGDSIESWRILELV